MANLTALNDVVKRARAARERTGHWPGSHAEALCNECERLQERFNELHALGQQAANRADDAERHLASKECCCPSGSYNKKHTPECYDAQLERLRYELRLMTDRKDAVNETLAKVVAERNELRSRVETTACRVRPHDFCSAGTCEVCRDAARYRFIRQDESKLDTDAEEDLAQVWGQIVKKGCWEARMDDVIDAALRSAVKSNEKPSASTGDTPPAPTSPVECPKCRTQLAFAGDECGLCKENDDAPINS